MTDEEKEILNNLKEYMQKKIDNGNHKIFYNDLGWDFKCIDCINTIDTVLNIIEKQSKEIEELKDFIEPIKAYSGNMERDKIMIFINEEYFPKLSISNFMIPKSKIKAKIEEIEKRRLQDGECELALYEFQREAKLEVLKSLLKEEE